MKIHVISEEDIVGDMSTPQCVVCGRTELAEDEGWHVDIHISSDVAGNTVREKRWRCPTCPEQQPAGNAGFIGISL
jgi:hypothetical protein